MERPEGVNRVDFIFPGEEGGARFPPSPPLRFFLGPNTPLHPHPYHNPMAATHPRHAESAVDAPLPAGLPEEDVSLRTPRLLKDFIFLQNDLERVGILIHRAHDSMG